MLGKAFKLFLALVGLLAVFVFHSEAKAQSPFPLPTIEAGEVKSGTEVVIPIKVANTTGREFISFEGFVLYDPNVFQFLNVEVWPASPAIGVNGDAKVIEAGRAKFGFYGFNPFSGSGDIAVIRMHVRGAVGAQSSIMVQDYMFNELKLGTVVSSANFVVVPDTVELHVRTSYMGDTNRPIPNVAFNLENQENIPDQIGVAPDGDWVFDTPRGNYLVSSLKTGGQQSDITAYDAALVFRCVLGLATNCDLKTADVSQDGQLSVYDAGAILRWSVGIEDLSGFIVAGQWYRRDVFMAPFSVQENLSIKLDFGLYGDVSQNWGLTPVQASSSTTEVSIENGLLVIQSSEAFVAVAIEVEGNTSLLGVADWTFIPNGNVLGGITGNPVNRLEIPMDGRITSVRLDEREPVSVDLVIEPVQKLDTQYYLPVVSR